MKFKIGDTVKIKKDSEFSYQDVHGIGTINREGRSKNWWGVVFKDGYQNSYKEDRDLEFAEKTLDTLEEGDVLVDDDDDETTVLGICGKVIFVSEWNDPTEFYIGHTIEEIKNNGWTLKDATPTEETIEIEGKKYSIKDIKEKLG